MRSILVCVVMAFSASCSIDSRSPLAPVPTPEAAPAPSPPPVVSGVTYPAGTYSLIKTGTQTGGSQFVLGDDGRFVLQAGERDFRGTYTYAASTGLITFAWEARSLAGPWEAWGQLQGNVMAVSYNVVMQLSDFEDESFRRVEP